MCSCTCVGMTFIWVFYNLAQVPSHQSRQNRADSGTLNIKSTQTNPGARADGTPCILLGSIYLFIRGDFFSSIFASFLLPCKPKAVTFP